MWGLIVFCFLKGKKVMADEFVLVKFGRSERINGKGVVASQGSGVLVIEQQYPHPSVSDICEDSVREG